MKKLLLPLFLLSFPFFTQANSIADNFNAEIEKCIKIGKEDPEKGVQCIDNAQNKWLYEEDFDEMRNVKSYTAVKMNSKSKSDRTIPLMITTKKNKSLIVAFGDAQCTSTCKISYKFDDNDIVVTEATGSHRMAIIAEKNVDKFINELISSKKLIVELPTSSGTKQIKYSVENFDSGKFIQ